MSTKYFQDLELTGAWDSAGIGQWTSDLAGLHVVADPVTGDHALLNAAVTAGPAMSVAVAELNDRGFAITSTANIVIGTGGLLALSGGTSVWSGSVSGPITANFGGGASNMSDLSAFSCTVNFDGSGTQNRNITGNGTSYTNGAVNLGTNGSDATFYSNSADVGITSSATYDGSQIFGANVGSATMQNASVLNGGNVSTLTCDTSCTLNGGTIASAVINVLPGVGASFSCGSTIGGMTINYASPVAGKLTNYNGLGANYYSPASAQSPKANEVTTTAGPAHNGVVFDGAVTGTAMAGRSWGRPRS